MANEHYIAQFCSALLLTLKETLRLAELMEDHMANEHSLGDFCLPLGTATAALAVELFRLYGSKQRKASSALGARVHGGNSVKIRYSVGQ
jgi:hypothetical protein